MKCKIIRDIVAMGQDLVNGEYGFNRFLTKMWLFHLQVDGWMMVNTVCHPCRRMN